jgi:cysteine desulfurase
MIYFDNAATTPIDDDVIEVMAQAMKNTYGNASSIHKAGVAAKNAMEDARVRVANLLHCDSREIYWTSGGTESDNWAIFGTVKLRANKGKHIITSQIEHHAVLHSFEQLEKEGFEVTYLPVDSDGYVSVADFEKAIRPDTIFVSIMLANNEIGTVQPISEIGAICKAKGIIMHTDAVQAVGHIPVDIEALNVDLLSFTAHKFNGPKGIGALYMNKKLRLPSYMIGGAHERGRRAGTENVPAILGLAKALEISCSHMDSEMARLTKLRDRLVDGVLKIPYTRVNGGLGGIDRRLPGNINFSIELIEGESILLMLDLKGICASSGSACTSGSLDPSHVLLALGLKHEIAHGSLRITLGKYNTEQEVDYFLEVFPPIVERLRMMSPLKK